MRIEAKDINEKTLQDLKENGFQWFKNNSTDRVEASLIADVVPAAEGFTVVYTAESVFKMSTAKVDYIDLAESKDQWNRVHWIDIKDERR